MRHIRNAVATVRHWIGFVAINAYVLVNPKSLDEQGRER